MRGRGKMVVWILLLLYVLTSSLGMVFIKKGGTNTSFSLDKGNFQIQLSWLILCGIIIYLLSFILWMIILQLFNLTYISPVAYGIVYIFIIIFSYILLNESIHKQQLIGAALIIVGIFIASYKHS